MAIALSEQRILFAKSGGRCAFPDCRRVLTAEGLAPDRPVVLGEVAHIVAESLDGPRGKAPLPLDQRNRYANLILLCNLHHQLADAHPNTYTVERMHGIKDEHERWVSETLGRADSWTQYAVPPTSVTETLHSTLLPVHRMPPLVYGVPCALTDERDVASKLRPLHAEEMAPFILRAGKLFTFQNLNYLGGPFADLASGQPVERWYCREWWDYPDRMKWFVDLTNRALNKLTGRRDLYLDKAHHRYYFQASEPGQPLEVEYRPLNQSIARRKVVWQPLSRRTGEPRNYWYHRAVSLRFVRIGKSEWCLSIRPELRVTVDGLNVLPPDEVGRKVTRKISRMYNYDLLGEVNFWRDYLSNSMPRIILRFGEKQHIVISTTLVQGTVTWPGIPEKHAKPFRNVEYVDDLFTLAEFDQLDADDDSGEPEEDEYADESHELDDDQD